MSIDSDAPRDANYDLGSWRREILLVDDNPGCVRLLLEALKESGLRYRATIAEDGWQALTILRRERKYADAPRPDIILLDLNLPRMDGHEVLAALKADPALRHIPVLILTSSSVEADRDWAYALGAEGFLVKPHTWEGYQQVAEAVVACRSRRQYSL